MDFYSNPLVSRLVPGLGCIAVLQAILFALPISGVSTDLRLAAGCSSLAVIATILFWIKNSKSWRLALVLSSGLIALGVFAFHLHSTDTYLFRSLYVAIAALWIANLLILGLGYFWRSTMTNLLLLAYSIGGTLVLAELAFSLAVRLGYIETRDFTAIQWEYDSPRTSHPLLGDYNMPNSTFRIVYPDNPRNYFQSNGEERFWNLTVFNTSTAELKLSADQKSPQVTISKAGEKIDWHIQLSYQFFALSDSKEYVLRFQARAKAPRPFTYSVMQAHAPWQGLGVWRETSLDTQWKKFTESFTPSDSEDMARIQFNLGTADPQVEIKDVKLIERDSGETVRPQAPQKHWVEYHFNSMGCRGRDYPIPKGPDTFRILALGDSVTLGVGVHEKDTFAAIIEQTLNQQAKDQGDKRRYEVINCGVSGWATKQERLFYELYGKEYQADLVLLTMVSNDTRSWREDVEMGYASDAPKKKELFDTLQYVNRQPAVKAPQDYSVVIKELELLRGQLTEKKIPMVIQFFSGYANEASRNLANSVTAALAGSGIPMLDTSEMASNRFSYSEFRVHSLDGHPNEVAHRYAAEQLIKLMTERKLLPPSNR